MSELNPNLLTIFISAIVALLVAFIGIWASRGDAASKLTGAALKMVEDVQEDCENLRKQVGTLQQVESGLLDRIRALEAELKNTKRTLESTVMTLEIAELNIKYLMEYMRENGLDVPDLKYRGGE